MIRFVLSFLSLITFVACSWNSSTGVTSTYKIYSTTLQDSVAISEYYVLENGNVASNTPVLFLLHGHGANNSDWFDPKKGNVAHLLDSLRKIKAIPPVLAVSIDAKNSWYVNSKQPMQTFFMQELFSHYDGKLNRNAKPFINNEHKILIGNSAGGYGSLRFAMLEPEQFKAAILLSPAAYYRVPPENSSSRKIDVFAKDQVFNDSVWHSYHYDRLFDGFKKASQKPVFYISTGDKDPYDITPVVKRLEVQLTSANALVNVRIIDGAHDWKAWRNNFVYALIAHFRLENSQ